MCFCEGVSFLAQFAMKQVPGAVHHSHISFVAKIKDMCQFPHGAPHKFVSSNGSVQDRKKLCPLLPPDLTGGHSLGNRQGLKHSKNPSFPSEAFCLPFECTLLPPAT